MGCTVSTTRDRTAFEHSSNIDQMLRAEKKLATSKVKLLLWGAAESGKSTIARQIKLIYEEAYTQEDIELYRPIVYNNIVTIFRSIVCAMNYLEIDFADSANIKIAQQFLENASSAVNPEILEIMKKLWADAGIQQSFARAREYQLNDSAAYYIKLLNEISKPNYIPTLEDVLKIRCGKATGIRETHFSYKGCIFEIYHFGDQQLEHKKWIYCFEGVTAIVFCAALTAYDLILEEEGKELNRMIQSLKQFDFICNSKWFVETAIVLFLNKKDLFEEKIQQSPLTFCFPEYTGPNTYENAANYIRMRYENLNKRKDQKKIYTHFTCATDGDNVRFVFDAVVDVIIRNNLNDCRRF